MARIFISHSSKDNASAIALRDWLAENGWDDIFLDLDPVRGIAAGEHWPEALRSAADRCEAVLCLLSENWLASRWCHSEFTLAKQFGKRIFPIAIAPVGLDRLPPEMTAQHQVVDLGQDPHAYVRLKEGLKRANLRADSFKFPQGRSPFPGLSALSEDDAAIYFGREAYVVRALDRLRAMRETRSANILVIQGASGAGKSSLIRAGLWPRLRRDDRNFLPLAVVRPGRNAVSGVDGLARALQKESIAQAINDVIAEAMPTAEQIAHELNRNPEHLTQFLQQLEEAIKPLQLDSSAPKPPTIILCIDQGEELFNMDGRAEVDALLRALRIALKNFPRLIVIIGIRTDSYSLLQREPHLNDFVKETIDLPFMPAGSFRAVIEGPARVLEQPLRLEPALVDALLMDSYQPDTLPLLAFALERLYRLHGLSGEITLCQYEALGRIQGALQVAIDEATTKGQADGILSTDPNKAEMLLRRTFVPDLAQFDGEKGFRKRIADLDELPPDTHPVVELLVEQHILTRGARLDGTQEKVTVEVSHDALFTAWPALAGWLDQAKGFLAWKRDVAPILAKWVGSSQLGREDHVLTGPHLSEAQHWYDRYRIEFDSALVTFVEESISKSYGGTLDRANRMARMTKATFVTFFALCAYLLVSVTSISHGDLLLLRPVVTPIVNVATDIEQFLLFMPLILVGFHCWVLLQHAVLAQRLFALERIMSEREKSDLVHFDTRRFDVDTYLFAQSLAGPPIGGGTSTFVRLLFWSTLLLLPLFVLLIFHGTALPLHSIKLTWTTRVAVLLDVVAIFLLFPRTFSTQASIGPAIRDMARNAPIISALSLVGSAAVLMATFFVLTVPGEQMDRLIGRLLASTSSNAFKSALAPSGSVLGVFPRNLIVTDTILAQAKREGRETEGTLILRGRDLRFAILDRSNLARADLTEANLEGASLVGTDLTEARLGCADVSELILSEDRTKARCVRAAGANLSRAKLTGARMAGIDLRNARLVEAMLEGAEMSYMLAHGANFSSANMQRADLTGGAQLQGANLLVANLQGASLFGALMVGADLSSTSLQGAVLTHAQLTGAILRDADMEGADLQFAQLQRADMSGAKIRAADLRGALVWQTSPPLGESLQLADLSALVVREIDPENTKSIRSAIERIDDDRTKRQVAEAVDPLFNAAETARWGAGPGRRTWAAYVIATQAVSQDTYAKDLTDHLVAMMCRARYANGSVATGIAQRAQGAMFRGSLPAIYERLRGRDCPAAAALSPRLIQRLAAANEASTSK